MPLTRTKEWLSEHLHNVAYVPDELKDHIASAVDEYHTDPWWLAEAIVRTAVEDQEAEGLIVQLMQTVESAVQKKMLMDHVCEIVEQVVDVLSYGLRMPTLKNAFNKDNALVTVYYVMMFTMSCAISEDRDDCEILAVVKTYEKIILAVASMASKLMVNNDVYEFIVETAETCLSRGKLLC